MPNLIYWKPRDGRARGIYDHTQNMIVVWPEDEMYHERRAEALSLGYCDWEPFYIRVSGEKPYVCTLEQYGLSDTQVSAVLELMPSLEPPARWLARQAEKVAA